MEYYTKNLIIGSGPAGCTAAIYSARANMKPILIQGNSIGGQLSITTDVENYPGFAKPIQGPWLMEEMSMQAKNVGAELIFDNIASIKAISDNSFELYGDSGDIYKAKTVIIATGAEAQWLNLASEKIFQGYGVSGCATCDGVFFKDQDVLVIGGGNTAVEEALHLTTHASMVTLIHRRETLKAEKVLQDRLFKHPKINILWNHTLDEVLGNLDPKTVTGAVLKSTKTNKLSTINASGIFIAIGHKPNTSIFNHLLKTDTEGYIITESNSTMTNVPGIYAAGDVQDKIYRQAVTAAGSGCMASLEAQKFLDQVN